GRTALDRGSLPGEVAARAGRIRLRRRRRGETACGGAGGEGHPGSRDRRRTARGCPRAGGDDRGAREREPRLQDPRGPAPHRPSVTVTISPLRGFPEVTTGADLAELAIASHAFQAGDILVLAQKVVSKSEGRVVRLAELEPSAKARELAGPDGDARHVEAILRESARIVRARGALVIAETRHGFVCASAGVDASNAPEPGTRVP